MLIGIILVVEMLNKEREREHVREYGRLKEGVDEEKRDHKPLEGK